LENVSFVPKNVSTSVIEVGLRIATFVLIAMSHPEKVEKLVKFTLSVRVPPAVGRVVSWGTIERHGAIKGQGPGDGPWA